MEKCQYTIEVPADERPESPPPTSGMAASDGETFWPSTLGFILHVLFIAIPRDIWRWLSMKPRDIHGETVVITGAGSGIGRRMAEILAIDHGARVAIIDIDAATAAATAEAITKEGGVAKSWQCDTTDAPRMQKTAEDILAEFGQVNIVICNAAILYFGHTLELTTDQLKRAFDVNIMGTLNTIRGFLPDMQRRNSGQVVTIGSVTSHIGETYGLAYCPSKFAVRGAMECIQMEMEDRGFDGITCTTVCPWFIRTPMILNMGMRPTSRILPFMSVNRSSREIIDGILKKKNISYVPSLVGLVVICKSFLPHFVQRAGRAYLDARYEPLTPSPTPDNNNDDTLLQQNSSDSCSTVDETAQMTVKRAAANRARRSYFRWASPVWYVVIPVALAFTFLVWWRPEAIPRQYLPVVGDFSYTLGTQYSTIVLWINILAFLAHLGEAGYALYLCDKLDLTHAASFKWTLQTFIVGFASLGILLRYRKKNTA